MTQEKHYRVKTRLMAVLLALMTAFTIFSCAGGGGGGAAPSAPSEKQMGRVVITGSTNQ